MNNGQVIYVDPYAGVGYDKPADFIFVTHDHFDHNQIERVAQKPDCKVITNKEALDMNATDGMYYKGFDFGDLKADVSMAYNSHHKQEECVGYILAFDGLMIYCSGDTGVTEQMKEFGKLGLDYAIFNTDDTYTIPFAESAKIAAVIGAKHNIPVHIKPLELFDVEKARQWDAPNKLIVEPGEEIEL
jgi:L-ascorbate metabolism protein UlaG (beta-lactamase superfamily)